MSTAELHRELSGINRRINRGRALERALWAGAALLLLLTLAATTDVLLRPGQTGRLLLLGPIALGLLVSAPALIVLLKRKRSPAAVAAILEHRFPALDNHLINRVLFSAHASESSWQRHYLRDPIPGWRDLPLEALKDRRARRWGAGLLAAAVLTLAAPGLWLGPLWGLSLARVLNPFAELTPPTLATLIRVDPGHTVVRQGEDLLLSCDATGRSGQAVELHLWPHDDRPSVVRLGVLTGEGEESFTHRIAKLAGPLQYRFRVGDAPPSERYRIDVRPPLAVDTLRLRIDPPAYTGFSPVTLDALSESITLPQYADVQLRLGLNREARSARLALEPGPLLDLEPDEEDRQAWTGALNVASGAVMRVTLMDPFGERLEVPLRFTLIEDQPPVLQVTHPTGELAPLAPGAPPVITFEADDDYALDEVRLERVDPDAPDATGEVLRVWPARDHRPHLGGEWRGVDDDLLAGTHFRLVARDYRGAQPGYETRSPVIRFVPASRAGALEAARVRDRATRATLAQLIAWQQENLERTLALQQALPSFERADGRDVRQRQADILRAADDLLRNPEGVPQPLRPMLLRARQQPMADVLGVLDRLDRAQIADRSALVDQTLELQRRILMMLGRGDGALERYAQQQSASGILAVIEALITNQAELIDATRNAHQMNRTPPALSIERQDALAVEVGELVTLCRRETERLAEGDAAYMDLLHELADLAEARRIQAQMLTAAEQMERNLLEAAGTAQQQAIDGLIALRDLLTGWRAQENEDEREQAQETVREAQEMLKRLADVQARVVEAMRQTDSQGDKSEGQDDDLLQELQEIKPRLADALLTVATDLHMMPDLPLSHELVEDLFQVYEAMEQAPGSDMAETWEEARLKEDAILDALEEAMERVDDMEMWLADEPDPVARRAEGVDQEEMPDFALTPLPDSLRDLIGDLMEQQEQMREETQDSASNQATPDAPFRAEVAEGDLTSFLAKGMSGNMPPEHVEQSGRSQIGREGMSAGETVAAGGMIEEGDDDIERRMTRDPSQEGAVESEGHTDAEATGGGKLSGFSDEFGMAGSTGPRRDALTDEGSELGRQAQLRQQAERLYAQASMNHVRTGNLDEAIRHMRQAEAALGEGRSISDVHEFQRRAVAALRATRSRLDAGIDDVALPGSETRRPVFDDAVASTPDDAPREYREMVADYFKALSEVLRD